MFLQTQILLWEIGWGKFERELAEYVGVKNVITCSDGTAALQLIYMAYGIGAGDAVFCPDMTFIASIEPAVMLGAVPVFCEIDAKSYNINSESLEKQINAVIKEGKLRARAIVAVDFLGNPADFEQLSEIAKKYGLLLIEDAAQSIGANIKEQKCGSFGNIAATSFFHQNLWDVMAMVVQFLRMMTRQRRLFVLLGYMGKELINTIMLELELILVWILFRQPFCCQS